MPVKHLAVDAETVSPDASLSEVARVMAEESLGDVVVTDGRTPVGILTDRDITLAYGHGENLDSLNARDVMTEDPVTIQGDAEAVELPEKMREGRVRRIPVVDDDGDLTGIATLDDVVATTGEELADIAKVIEAQSPGYSP